MRLNWLGRATMNNPVRSLGQSYAASWLERLGGRVEGGRVLEVGCGGGAGVKIILERFGAAAVEAFDLDPKMIETARRRLAAYGLTRVQLSVGDVTSIKAADATFDAVFDFGAIHLEPNWQKALAEVRRVLKPGGKFFSSGSPVAPCGLPIHWSQKPLAAWSRPVPTYCCTNSSAKES